MMFEDTLRESIASSLRGTNANADPSQVADHLAANTEPRPIFAHGSRAATAPNL